MDVAGAGRLMDQGTLATWVEFGEAPDWVGNHWRTFNESLLCRTPFYDERRSRYYPVGLEITFQPRALFEGLDVTADIKAGQRARGIIQDRLEEYDGVCPHADLGDWGVEGDREWVQYMLSADDDQFPETCPITVTREHPKSDRLRPEASADEPDGEATDPSRER